MIAALVLTALVGGRPTEVGTLLAEGRFAEAEASARRGGDTGELAEVWFRAGLYERVLEMSPDDVRRASSPLVFTHRRAAAALRVGSEVRARAAVVELDRLVGVTPFDGPEERAAWRAEVDAFRSALERDTHGAEQLARAVVRARVVSLVLLGGAGVSLALLVLRR